MAKLYVDNAPYEFHGEDRNLLDVCLSLGFNVPYFCWHPAMHSVGACRQCAVMQFKNADDTKGRLVMACMTPAADGTRISIDHPEAVAFRKRCIEWLMINHPHDCPVCDEGGECHLQDMTVMTGHAYRRHRFKKRTHHNQDLGPFVNHEMNRCIQCYRCVRFYQDVAGGHDLVVLGWHDHVYFGRHEDGTLESPFAGNLVEVCPTGVFTDKTLKRHYTRKWDLQSAPSVCVHCGLGCNTIPGERYGMLRRIYTRFNDEVNGYFLCDRGRFGYEFVNSDRRIRKPLVRGPGGKLEVADAATAAKKVAGLVAGGRAVGIGSPRASLETNFALRTLVGPDRFFHGMSGLEYSLAASIASVLGEGPAGGVSLREAAKADAVLNLGEDAGHTAPMLVLSLREAILQKPLRDVSPLELEPWHDAALREAIQEERGPLYIATPAATAMDHRAKGTYRAAPEDIARLAFAVAHEIDSGSPDAPDLPADARDLAKRIAADLASSRRPLVVSGMSCQSESIIQASANVARALLRKGLPCGLFFTVPECDTMGAALMGGRSLEDAAKMVTSGQADTVIIAENDIRRRVEPRVAREILGAKHVIVLDHLEDSVAPGVEVVLPAATFAESSGTLVNNEGRAQRFFRVFAPDAPVTDTWRWIAGIIAARDDKPAPWSTLDAIMAAMAREISVFSGVPGAAPAEDARLVGRKVPRQASRYTGRTAMTANIDVHEPQPPEDGDAPMSFSMEGFGGQPPAALVARFWAPGWNSIQAINKFQDEVGGPLRGGGAGVRLIECRDGGDAVFYAGIPSGFKPRDKELLVVPLWHVFGSDELSIHSPGVAQLAPKGYVAVNPADLRRLGLEGRAEVAVSAGGATLRVALVEDNTLPCGVAGLPVGLPGLPGIQLPSWATLSEAPRAVGEGGGR